MVMRIGVRAVVSIVAAAATMVLGTPAIAAPPGNAEGRLGSVVSIEPLPRDLWLPNAANASVLTYWTTGPLNKPALSTGAIFTPPGSPPAGGWPVVSWGHGAVGIGDDCAPTVTGKIGGSYLRHWFSQGYAVVATDYVGLGTPGVHPYLDGTSEAHSMVDMVRAARAVEPALSRSWVAIGQSQGGQAALFAASLATKYAPELDYRGAVATGVPSNIENLVTLAGPNFPELPLRGTTVFLAYALAGLRAAYPNLGVDGYLSAVGLKVLEQVETWCYEQAEAQLDGISIGDLLSRQLDDPALLDAARRALAIPTRDYDRPIFVGQGMLDTIVPAPLTLKLAAELAANGEPLTFRPYSTGHLETMPASLPDTTVFVRELFAR